MYFKYFKQWKIEIKFFYTITFKSQIVLLLSKINNKNQNCFSFIIFTFILFSTLQPNVHMNMKLKSGVQFTFLACFILD